MSKMDYNSVFAPYILDLLEKKRAEGYVYKHAAAMLHLFDLYCVERGFQEKHLTRELLADWVVLRDGERRRYQSQRVTYVRQLAIYMSSIGIDTCIPRKMYREPCKGPKMMPFASSLAPYIQGLIDQKRAGGYKYDMEALTLYQFDRFCQERGVAGNSLSRDIAMEWLARRSSEGNRARNSRAACIRQLAKYMLSLGKDAYVPFGSSTELKPVPHILTQEELQAFFFEVDHFKPGYRSKDRMAMAYSVMFRLFYCCGMRLQEVCKLRISDVDLETGRITVYQSKGHRDRIVFMTADLLLICRRYDKAVRVSLPQREWFFTASEEASPFYKTNMCRRFKYFWDKTPFAGKVDREPTIHALRHTFVVHRINSWMGEGGDFQTLLPYLSRYLGHKSFDETYYYYHLTISAFDVVKRRDTVSARVIPEVMPCEA